MQDPRKTRQILIPSFTVAVGVQDGSFESFHRGIDSPVQYTSLCCTSLHGFRMVDLNVVPITIDGLDSTEKIVTYLEKSKANVVFLGGATFAGFNVVDALKIHNTCGVPIIVYMTKYPDLRATRSALRKHFPDWEKRWMRYMALGDIYMIDYEKFPSAYFEVIGASPKVAQKLIRENIKEGRMPEPLRLANLIAKGTSSVFQGLTERGHVF